jgi:serine/threonine-protein kinase RsbT
MPGEVCVPILSEADIVAARRRGRDLALSLGFGGADLTLIATAISEITRNIVKYAGQGELRLWTEERGLWAGDVVLVVQARDQGPGIADLEMAMKDGFSSSQGLGLGLPGAKRLMDDFSIESAPGKGTVVTLKKWARRQ